MMISLVLPKAPFVDLVEKLSQLLDEFRLHEEIFHVVEEAGFCTLIQTVA